MGKTHNSDDRNLSAGRILCGSLLGSTLTAALTFLAAFALSREVLPLSACAWLGPVIVAFSAALAARFSARKNSRKLLCGLLSALFYGCILLIVGLLLFTAPMEGGRMAVSFGALLLGGFGGTVSAVLTD